MTVIQFAQHKDPVALLMEHFNRWQIAFDIMPKNPVRNNSWYIRYNSYAVCQLKRAISFAALCKGKSRDM